MKKDLSKYRLISLITLFLIFTVYVSSLAFSQDMMVISESHLSGIETHSKDEKNLELKTNEPRSTSDGLKVEIVAISMPVSFYSGDNHMSDSNLLIKIYSKKKYSLISHSNLIISNTLNLSPLITKLQI